MLEHQHIQVSSWNLLTYTVQFVCVCHDQFNHVKHKMYFSCVLCFLCLLLLLFCFLFFLSCLFTVFLCFRLEGWKNLHVCMTIVYLSIYLNIYLSIYLNIYMIYIYRYISYIPSSLVAFGDLVHFPIDSYDFPIESPMIWSISTSPIEVTTEGGTGREIPIKSFQEAWRLAKDPLLGGKNISYLYVYTIHIIYGWYKYIFIFKYVYIYMYVCIYMCVCVCVCVRFYICFSLYVYMCVYIVVNHVCIVQYVTVYV
jgi:hypothetical protein